VSFTCALALLSPIWRDRPSASSPSTTSATPGVMDQKGQERNQMDTPVVPLLRRQRASPAPRPCLQPRQLHADAGAAQGGGAVVLTSLREKLIKMGAKVVSHGRYVTSQMAEVSVSRQMFQENPVTDRPAPSTTRTGVSGGVRCDRRRQRCAFIKPKQRVPAL
jgi:hypothetical protein